MPVGAIIKIDPIEFQFLDYPVQIEEETRFAIRISQSGEFPAIRSAKARIEGVNMYMGIVQVFFVEESFNSKIVQGSFFLGSCSEAHMQWRLFLELGLEDGEKIHQSLDFSTTL